MAAGKVRVLVLGGSGIIGSALRFEPSRAGLSIEAAIDSTLVAGRHDL